MKVRIDRHEFAEALAAVNGVLAARTTKPILQCLLFQVEADSAVLATTDLELSVRYTVSHVEVTTPGVVVVSAEKMGQIIRESTDETVVMESNEQTCHLRGADSHFQLVLQDPAEFPAIAHLDGAADFDVPASLLHGMVTWTTFAAARENTRYAINGVLWEKRKDNLLLVATDGRRLSLATGKVQDKGSGDKSAIVPIKATNLFQRLVTAEDESVGVRITDNQVVLTTARATLATALVEGRFPQYRDVIPTDSNRKIELPAQDLLSAIRRAALLTNEESRGVRLAFADDTLTLTSRAPEQGEARITMPIQYKQEPIEIGFNPVFLTDMLRVAPAEQVQLELKGPDKPGVVRCGPDWLYVVMPINLA